MSESTYLALRHLHLGAVGLSLALFALRGAWMLSGSARLQARWVKIAPHAVDTVLLGAGIGLAVSLHQYPFVHGWLTAKVLALLAYIGLGTVALKRGRTKAIRTTAFAGALAVFAYIVGVAITRQPLSWLAYAGG